MYKILAVLMIFSTAFFSFSQDEENSSQKEEATKKRNYSEKEFFAAVKKQAIKRMRRAGHSKLISFSEELLNREKELKEREVKLDKIKEQLEINQKYFESRISQFEQRQKKIIGCLDGQNEAITKRVTHMVDVISNMRPANAAEVLSVQDADISVKILGRLDAVKVSKIFNLMKREISARLQKQYMTMKK